MSDEEKSSSEPEITIPYAEGNSSIQEKILSGRYKLKPKDGRSKIWNVFSAIEDDSGFIVPDRVCCIHCYTILTFNKRTSSNNLARHKCCRKYKFSNISKTTITGRIEKRTLLSPLKTEGSKLKIPIICNPSHSEERNQIRQNILDGIFKLRTKISKCKVWQIFKLIEDSEGNKLTKKVCCNICFQVLNFHEHTTSNLVKHKCYVKAKNTISFESNFIKTTDEDSLEIESSNCLENVNTKKNECLEPTSYTDLDEFPPTKEWEKSYTTQELKEIPSSNEDVNINIKTEVEKIFSEWCIENFRPFRIAKDSGLRRFAEFMIWIGANYGTIVDIDNLLPETKNISKYITAKYEETFNNIKNDIAKECQNGYGLTSKVWIDNYRQQSYITLTIHYIKNGKLISKLLGLNAVRNEETINNIIEVKLQQTLNNYNCFCDDSIIVTNGSFTMCTALNNFTHINCINHVLDNAINKAIKEVEEIEKLYNQCLKIKEFYTQSNIKCNLTAIFDSLCLTNWNAFYYLLYAIQTNWLEIEINLHENFQILEFEEINEQHIEQVLNILKPFEHVSKKLECKEHPTIHLVYACINGLEGSCSANDNCDYNIRKFKEVLGKQLKTTVFSNIGITHKIALFFFPPANKLIQFSEDEKTLIKTTINVMLKPYAQNNNTSLNSDKETPSTSFKSSTMLNSYLKNFVTPPKNDNYSDQISNEIYTYECLNIPFEDNFDVLQWWHLRQSQLPLLYKLSCKILATPATCSSSDLALSMVKQMAEHNGNILSNLEKLNQLVFLKFNSEKATTFEELYSEDIRIENNVTEEI